VVEFNIEKVEERVLKERTEDMEAKATCVLKDLYARRDKAELALRNIIKDIEKVKAEMPDNLIYESAGVIPGTVYANAIQGSVGNGRA